MILKTLRLLNFRAHQETTVDFAPGVNLLYGSNGAGKTNILEAIHYLCLSKSFLVSNDGYVLRKGRPFFEAEGVFEGNHRTTLKARLVYVPEEGKRLFINGAPLERLSQIVGVLPIVVFSPDDYVLTAGGPEERRRLLDNVLSQSRPLYLDDLLKYRRALRQRNELLGQSRRTRRAPPSGLLASWDEELVQLGSRVITSRLRFITEFSGFLEAAYVHMEAVSEKPTIAYTTIGRLDADADQEQVVERYRAQLVRAEEQERALGRTLVGPHRDELIFRLNGLEVRRYASQGQHRTFGMALKLAQYLYLHDRLDEKPILLLDDVFDNLDLQRARLFVNLLSTDLIGQSVLTAARRDLFADLLPFDEPTHRITKVENGRVERAKGIVE